MKIPYKKIELCWIILILTILIIIAIPSFIQRCPRRDVAKEIARKIMRAQAAHHINKRNFVTLKQLKKEGTLYSIDEIDKYWQILVESKDNLMFAYILPRKNIDNRYALNSYLGITAYDKKNDNYKFLLCISEKGIYLTQTQLNLFQNQSNLNWKCPPHTKFYDILKSDISQAMKCD